MKKFCENCRILKNQNCKKLPEKKTCFCESKTKETPFWRKHSAEDAETEKPSRKRQGLTRRAR